MKKKGVTYDGAEPRALAPGYEPYPHLIGWTGPVLTGLAGIRPDPYRPRTPVLLDSQTVLANELRAHLDIGKGRGRGRRRLLAGPGVTIPDFGKIDEFELPDPAIPVNTDDPVPDTDRCPSSGLEELQRKPVPVTEASGKRRTRKDGPKPSQPCVVCGRHFKAASATQVCCDRKCGGVYRSNRRQEAEAARRVRAGFTI